MVRPLTWKALCALAAALAGCTASVPVETTSRHEWRHICDCLGAHDERLAITVAPASLTQNDEARLVRIAATATASVVWIETISASRPTRGADSADARAHGIATSDSRLNTSGGTGVVVQKDGLILTNDHVVRGATRMVVILADGSRHDARHIASANPLDLALVQIDRRDLPAIGMTGMPARTGEPVVAVGGRQFAESSGRRSGRVTQAAASLQNKLDPARRHDYTRLVESTVQLDPGFSGGPLLDSHGRLVGLNVAMIGRAGQAHCRGYAIPFDEATHRTIRALLSR